MFVSTLIEQLQEYKNKYGDLSVTMFKDDSGEDNILDVLADENTISIYNFI